MEIYTFYVFVVNVCVQGRKIKSILNVDAIIILHTLYFLKREKDEYWKKQQGMTGNFLGQSTEKTISLVLRVLSQRVTH